MHSIIFLELSNDLLAALEQMSGFTAFFFSDCFHVVIERRNP